MRATGESALRTVTLGTPGRLAAFIGRCRMASARERGDSSLNAVATHRWSFTFERDHRCSIGKKARPSGRRIISRRGK
jgi:hypothetical protein